MTWPPVHDSEYRHAAEGRPYGSYRPGPSYGPPQAYPVPVSNEGHVPSFSSSYYQERDGASDSSTSVGPPRAPASNPTPPDSNDGRRPAPDTAFAEPQQRPHQARPLGSSEGVSYDVKGEHSPPPRRGPEWSSDTPYAPLSTQTRLDNHPEHRDGRAVGPYYGSQPSHLDLAHTPSTSTEGAPPPEGRHVQAYSPPQQYPPAAANPGPAYRYPSNPANGYYHYAPPPPHGDPYHSASGWPTYQGPTYAQRPPPNETQPLPHVHAEYGTNPSQPGGVPYESPQPHPAGPPAAPAGYKYHYYIGAPRPRKGVRAVAACDSCRQRKAKCDEGRPRCQHCQDNGLECSYREIPPPKSETQVAVFTEKLEKLSEKLDQTNEKLDLLASRVNEQGDDGKEVRGQTKQLTKRSDHAPGQTRHTGEDLSPRDVSTTGCQSTQGLRQGEKAVDNDVGTNFAMPLQHTTGVHNLFEWDSIKSLLSQKQSTSYVMDLEIERGLLRLHGCGEGEDKGDGHEGAPSSTGSSPWEAIRMDEDTSLASPREIWGDGRFHLPQAFPHSHTAKQHPGGLSPRGGLMLDSEAVDLYFRLYMDNMHILHPFLEPKVLREMVYRFKKRYSRDSDVKHVVIGTKRKREATNSPAPTEQMDIDPQNNQVRLGSTTSYTASIEHSVANAIVLLILALGKVCSHRQPVPGPASTTTMHASTPHTMHSTLSDLPFPESVPTSPFNYQLHLDSGRAKAVRSPSNSWGKNMDVVPGLSYFAIAAGILGELSGGVVVSYVQANLLAGLYMGQLGRIIQSHSYISVACRACQSLIKSTDYKSGNTKPARRNLINFAFWTCLQLESDILAEIDLPQSGISRYESAQLVEIPTGVTLDTFEPGDQVSDVLRFYYYQIQLRRTMNEVHSALYEKSKQSPKPAKPAMRMIGILDTNIDAWRKMLNDWDWDDDEHQSENINVARMRAKYYGAKYIIHRPVLYHALQHACPTPPTPNSKYSDSPEAREHFASPVPHAHPPSTQSRRRSEIGPPGSSPVKVDSKIIAASKLCVEAAIRSTTVFDKVPKRLIVTNIFGTAHAQFGNMLVLSATYTSPLPELSSLVDEATLRELFDRTIQILQEHESISPVLKHDAILLQDVRANIFPDSYYPPTSNKGSLPI